MIYPLRRTTDCTLCLQPEGRISPLSHFGARSVESLAITQCPPTKVMCADEGTFEVATSSSNPDSELNNLPRADGGVTLWRFRVNPEDSLFADLPGNDVADLPLAFPPKPRYLDDLSTLNEAEIAQCQCPSFDPADFDGNGCVVQMRQTQGGTNHVINDLLFDPAVPLQVLQFDDVYEFTLDLGTHVYHQHIVPFQLQQDIGSGLLGKARDYFDTVGADAPFTVRTALYDYSGTMVLHCHLLPHEVVIHIHELPNRSPSVHCSGSRDDVILHRR